MGREMAAELGLCCWKEKIMNGLRVLLAFAAFQGLWIQHAVATDIHVANSAELNDALRSASAGDAILLAPGKYRGGISQIGLKGTKENPIVIAAADPKNPPVIEGGGSGIHLRSPAHVELRDLIVSGATGNGINIDDGGDANAPAMGLVLKNIIVREVGPRGNCDGIKLSGVDRFILENCQVQRWGSSGSAIDMVGCHEGIIRDCKFSDATSDNANGVQTKGGSSKIKIERCEFVNSGGRAVNAGGSTGPDYFRPKDATYEAKDITIEDCTFRGGMSAIAFVGVDGAVARHNTIYCPSKWAFRVLQENNDARFAKCGNVKVEHNVIAFRTSEVRDAANVGSNTEPTTFTFKNNVWCCLDRPADAKRIVRLPSNETGGVYDFTPRFKNAKNGDLTLLEPAPNQAGVR
jgi:hypothetical protein